jgi:uncharacterized membrane protein YeaQ/YmgE (transglycosylase-associated protein family)
MSTKAWVTVCVLIGSIIGGYLPVLWGYSAFSMTSLITSAIGGIVGIWIGLKLGN